MRTPTGLCCALLLVALTLGLCLFPTRRAAAANFTVNSLADTPDANASDGICADAGGACTLRAAIQQANADPAADTIGFSVNGAIDLIHELPGLSTNITINGPGASLLTVRRGSNGDFLRIFRVAGGATVSISGLTIAGGILGVTGVTPGGGGVLNSGTLSMSNCVVSGNSTTDASNDGFLSLPATHGGGIYNEGVMTLTGCSVSNNSTGKGGTAGVNAAGANGGGIYNIGDLTLTNCNVNGNTTGRGGLVPLGGGLVGAGGNGGGIYNAGTLRMTASTVDGNRTGDGSNAAAGSSAPAGNGGSGGGIYNNATLTVVNGVVSRNVTGKGGSTASNINCPLVGVGGDGGGIYSASGSTLKLSQSTVVLNQTGVGGSLSNGGTCTARGLGGGLAGVGQLRGNIVALNLVPPSVTNFNNHNGRDLAGTFQSLGYNYFGVANITRASTDREGTRGGNDNYNDDLRLDLTTLIPIQGSPVIDIGLARDADEQPVTTDRRGAHRPFDFASVAPQAGGDDSDMGAFERQDTDPVTTVQFGANTYTVGEGCVAATVTLTRTGPVDLRSVVTYAVSAGTASQRGDFTLTRGSVFFGLGVSTQSVPVLISEDAYAEGAEDLTVTLTSATDAQVGMPNSATLRIEDNDAADGAANPIDDNATFVGQHYHDFLSRQSDSNGQFFWTNQLNGCGGDPGCLDRKRMEVSAAFFFSIEFQQSGFFVIRVNKAAFGDQPGNPRYLAFLADAQEAGGVVVGQDSNWQSQIEANKTAYVARFVQRPDFLAAHGGQNAEQYVDSLFANAGVTPTAAERNAAINAYGSSNRAGALRSVVESASVFNKLYNPGFVLMQYFAYLRRDPDAAPDNNFDGYNYWLSKLNQFTQPGEDARDESVALARARRAEMVRAFILSSEYRGRFQGDPSRGQ